MTSLRLIRMLPATFALLLPGHSDAQSESPAPLEETAIEVPAALPQDPPMPAAPPAPEAQEETALGQEATWYEDLSINAFISASGIHNFALSNTHSGGNIGRVFDRDNDSLKVDVAEVVLQDEPEQLGEGGFRLDIVHGQVIPSVIGGADLAIQQAYLSYIAPWGTGVRFDVGTFLSHIGAETIEGYDNVNDTYSRSVLFIATPPKLTGARVTYRIGEALSVTGLAVNGWAPNVLDNNGGKSLGLQVALTPLPQLAVYLHYLGGPEKNDNNHDVRHTVDAVVVARLHPVTVTVEALWGHEDNSGGAATDWGGGLVTLRWDINPIWTIAARGEYFDNRQSFKNLGTQLAEFTLTPSLKLTDNMMLRLEYRHDHSVDQAAAIFRTKQGLVTSQNTLAGNLLFVF